MGRGGCGGGEAAGTKLLVCLLLQGVSQTQAASLQLLPYTQYLLNLKSTDEFTRRQRAEAWQEGTQICA